MLAGLPCEIRSRCVGRRDGAAGDAPDDAAPGARLSVTRSAPRRPADKDDRLRVHAEDPPNLGTPLDLLDARLTAPEHFFVRCHGPIPVIGDDFVIRVDGLVERSLEIGLSDLRVRFPAHSVEAALICAGNRRAGFSVVEPTLGELQWKGDAVGNAVWTGAPLAAVLDAAGLRPGAAHVAFEGVDVPANAPPGTTFGGSIPIGEALHGGVLLAYEMGGAPLPPEHGFPVRALVPGYVGARSVKWLSRITVQAEPSDNPFQARDYRLFARHVRPETARHEEGIPLGETPVDSSITHPLDGARLVGGRIAVRGYALAGGDRTVERVEVTADGGFGWQVADFLDDDEPQAERRWRWRRWQVELELQPGEREIAVRAWDSAANTQPDDPVSIWNFAGYANNSWHRVRVVVLAEGASA